ncbi:MAG: TIGR03826 family flagellar region protein [Solirubrobacterales bacterium]
MRNCPRCDALFGYVGKPLCRKCLDAEEDQFKKVRTYVRDHPGATVTQTAEACEVDEEMIIRYLREGRLISKALKASVSITCERCGATISEGRFCRSCAVKLNNALQNSIGADEPQDEPDVEPAKRRGDRMHTVDGPRRGLGNN